MQDPREKLERFPKLGYYFLSFRAIESWGNREKLWDQDGDEHDQGVVGEANVYLVVFNEGICSFHFTDISGELVTARFGNMLITTFQIISTGSETGLSCSKNQPTCLQASCKFRMIVLVLNVLVLDWIAHGILDSIVDSFFPFLQGWFFISFLRRLPNVLCKD